MASKQAIAAVVSYSRGNISEGANISHSFYIYRILLAFTPHLVWAKVCTYYQILFVYSCCCVETIASLQAFRKRHGEAQRVQAQYPSQPTTVDLEHYRSILKNKAIVDEAAKLLKDFKPVTYDVNAHIKAIETFETSAVAKAKETVAKVDVELKDLQATLANIENARPFEDLTVSCSTFISLGSRI